MADRVQYILDRMSSVFKQLIELKLFTEVEVTSIVNKRRDFEYLISRRQLQPADYYSYIQYEVNLFKLCKVRHGKQRDGDLQKKQRHILALMMRHSTYVFDRAIRRFSSEMDLWMDYLAFLKDNGSTTLFSALLGKALSLYPKNETFWSIAAMHEIETNNNSHAARVLLQRSLRVNKKSRALWTKYFEVELWNALRLLERKTILGLATPEDFLSANAVAVAVFRHAIVAIGDVKFACELHSLASQSSAAVADSVVEHLKTAFGSSPEVWAYLASLETNKALTAALVEDESNPKKRKTEGEGEEEERAAGSIIGACQAALDRSLQTLQTGVAGFVSAAEHSVGEASEDFRVISLRTVLASLDTIYVRLEEVTALPVARSEPAGAQSAKKKRGRRAASEDPVQLEATSDADSLDAAVSSLQASKDSLVRWALEQAESESAAGAVTASQPAVSISEELLVLIRFRNWLIESSLRPGPVAASETVLSADAVVTWVDQTADRIITDTANKRRKQHVLSDQIFAVASSSSSSGYSSSKGKAVNVNDLVASSVTAWGEVVRVLLGASARVSLLSGVDEGVFVTRVCSVSLKCAALATCSDVGQVVLQSSVDYLHAAHQADLTWEAGLRAAIRSDVCPPELRGDLCLKHLSLSIEFEQDNQSASPETTVAAKSTAAGDSDDEDVPAAAAVSLPSFKTSYEWIVHTSTHNPQLFVRQYLSSFYVLAAQEAIRRAAVSAEVTASAAAPKTSAIRFSKSLTVSSSASSAGRSRELAEARSIVERGVTECVDTVELWDALEQVESLAGDVAALNHVRWRRSKAAGDVAV